MSLTIAQAKSFYEAGFIEDFIIIRIEGCYSIHLGPQGKRRILVDARTKTERLFKSLDSAIATLETIGFKIVTLGHAE